MCMHDRQAHAWRGMHLEVRGQPSPLSCWDLMVSLVSATACYRLSGLWTPVNFWVIPTSALSILPQECWIADVDHWIQLPPLPPATHTLFNKVVRLCIASTFTHEPFTWPQVFGFLVFLLVYCGRGGYIMTYVCEVDGQHAGVGSLLS